MEGDDRPARARRHRSSRGMAGPCPRRRYRRAQGGARCASRPARRNILQHEHRIRHEDGTYRRFLCRGVAARGAGRRPARIAGSLTDTTERASAQERLRSAGFPDPLTGLCNRADFVEGLGRRLDEFKQRRGGGRFAALYLDLDRFKVVNDSLGHLVGDELLTRGVASPRIVPAAGRRAGAARRRRVRDSPERARRREAGQRRRVPDPGRAERALLNRRPGSLHLRQHRHRLRPGAITTTRRDHARRRHRDVSREVARQGASRAVRRRHARARARPARPRERPAARGQQQRLRGALSADRARWPRGCASGSNRWSDGHATAKPVSPATFIPIAEELGIIEPLGTWVLQQACSTFADWQRRFPAGGLDYITVNVSSRQLMQQNFLWLVEQAVHHAGLKPCDLRLEITETALMDSPHEAAKLLGELREFGAKIYLDDFGTRLLVAQSPAQASGRRAQDRPLVREEPAAPRPSGDRREHPRAGQDAQHQCGRRRDRGRRQARELERLGCTHAQGYLFSRPLSTSAVEELLVANRPLGPKGVQLYNPTAMTGNAREWHSSATPLASV